MFEAAFALEDSEDPSRAGTPVRGRTPKPAGEKSERPASGIVNPQEAKEISAENGASTPNTEKKEGEAVAGEKGAAGSSVSPAELPMEVRVKLRKFERLESTYTG